MRKKLKSGEEVELMLTSKVMRRDVFEILIEPEFRNVQLGQNPQTRITFMIGTEHSLECSTRKRPV